MKSVKLSLLFFSILLATGLSAQERYEEPAKIKISIPSQATKQAIDRWIQMRHRLTNLQVTFLLVEDSVAYSAFFYSEDSVVSLLPGVNKKTTSLIKFKRGALWNSKYSSRSEPSKFYKRVLKSSDYQQDPELVNWIQYLEVCHYWKKNKKFPTHFIDKFVVTSDIQNQDGASYHVELELAYDDQNKIKEVQRNISKLGF